MPNSQSPFDASELARVIADASDALTQIIGKVAAKGAAKTPGDVALAKQCAAESASVVALAPGAVATALNTILAIDEADAKTLRAIITKMKATARTIDNTEQTWKTCVDVVSAVKDILAGAIKDPGGVLMGIAAAGEIWAPKPPNPGSTGTGGST